MDQSSQDLQREIERLRKELERVAERATQREADFGAVKAKAERVEALEEKVRELSRVVARLGGHLPGETRPAALGAASAAGIHSGAGVVVTSSVDDLALAVAERLRSTGLLADAVKGPRTEPAKPGAQPGLADLAQRAYGSVKATGVEDKLLDILRDRARTEVDPKTLVNAAVERLIKELDLKLLTQRVADALVQRIELTMRPRPLG